MKKIGIHQKTDEKTLLGTTFLGKHQIWGDFGVPGRSLGKALGRILGRNFGGGKNDEKTVVSVVASAGNADPGKEGFREDNGQPGLARLRPAGDGRIVAAELSHRPSPITNR